MPLIPFAAVGYLPEETPTVSAIETRNHALAAAHRAVRLSKAPHKESYGCNSCGHTWLVKIGRNGLPESTVDCPRCGEAGEP